MENPEKEISRAEEAPLFTDEDFGNLETFQEAAKRAVGEDPHQEHIKFEELSMDDSFLAEKFIAGLLTMDDIKEAKQDAVDTKQFSSAAFRGWLANMLHRQVLHQAVESGKQDDHE